MRFATVFEKDPKESAELGRACCSSSAWRKTIRVYRTALLAGHVLLLTQFGFAQEPDPVAELPPAKVQSGFQKGIDSIQVKDIRQHIHTLASDTFEGRGAGTAGGKAAGIYLAQQLRKSELQGAVSTTTYFQEFGNEMRNILGLLPGDSPEFKNDFIVIGAHYDHVGYGTSENSNGPVGYIHNGADDNASGVATLLEVAQAWHASGERPKRSLVFALWDGEEQGLLGSKHFLANPPCPVSAIKCAINMDMVGRVRNDSLEVTGIRTCPGFRRMLSEQNGPSQLKLNFFWKVEDNSDNYSFYLKRIPFVMPFSGFHNDYHTPADDVDKVNLEGIERVARWMFGITRELANRPVLPPFREACLQENDNVRKQRETLGPGLIPRVAVTWAAPDGNSGRLINQVTPQSRAAIAGLQAGDRLIQWGYQQIASDTNVPGLSLVTSSPVTVIVERPGVAQPISLSLPLEGNPVRIGVTWTEDSAEPGVVILNMVDTYSPAGLAGLKVRDRILRVGQQNFSSGEECRKLLLEHPSPIALVVERDGLLRSATIRIPDDPTVLPKGAETKAPPPPD